MFDSHYAYSNLGEYSFNHDAIEKFPFDWEQMIQSNIGMGLKSFKRLVFPSKLPKYPEISLKNPEILTFILIFPVSAQFRPQAAYCVFLASRF